MALFRNRVITNHSVLGAFRDVPRGFFLPMVTEEEAYADAPLRSGFVHLSAPHIYGCVAEALELKPGASFLNIGSGTG